MKTVQQTSAFQIRVAKDECNSTSFSLDQAISDCNQKVLTAKEKVTINYSFERLGLALIRNGRGIYSIDQIYCTHSHRVIAEAERAAVVIQRENPGEILMLQDTEEKTLMLSKFSVL